MSASTTIEAAPEVVFAVLADPSAHAEIDGTGWVREYLRFPPFGPDHLANSLQHLSDLVARNTAP